MKNIVIIGAGDLGKEVVWLIEDINKVSPTYVILGFLDDDTDKIGDEFYGYRVLGKVDYLTELAASTPLGGSYRYSWDGSVRRKIREKAWLTSHPGNLSFILLRLSHRQVLQRKRQCHFSAGPRYQLTQ